MQCSKPLMSIFLTQNMHKNILITGGCGFIGSHFVTLAEKHFEQVIVLDALTYAATNAPVSLHLNNVVYVNGATYYKGDINNADFVKCILQKHSIDVVVNFAAETHVDNSINNSAAFLHSNANGVHALLESCRATWRNDVAHKRFIHVSTDEVFGSLAGDQESFTETTPYAPRNPYSASKAAGDHMVAAYVNTFNFPAIITHCCNNYGEGQHAEKLIPKCISHVHMRKHIPVYGQGLNVREWIHAQDHCNGILMAIKNGKVGEHYNFGTGYEISNIELINKICKCMHADAATRIKYVEDRKGHDLRYSINSTKANEQLGWKPAIEFDVGLQQTIAWYQKYLSCASSEF